MTFRRDTDHQSQAVGGAIAWLAFYAIAVVAVAVSYFQAAQVLVALAN